jgi:hypothetical protein
MKCVLCENEIIPDAAGWGMGNNAQPLADGRCCDDCAKGAVLPARLARIVGKKPLVHQIHPGGPGYRKESSDG